MANISGTLYDDVIISGAAGYWKGGVFYAYAANKSTFINDSISGGNGQDYIDGDNGNDTISGGNGIDTLHGGCGNDLIYGDAKNSVDKGNGIDYLYGDAGNDTLFGGNGTDFLYGGADSDRMDGDNGNDLLQGDGGADFLTGDKGSDTFKYKLVSDSAATGGAWDATKGDTICDFQTGQDKLDLSCVPLTGDNPPGKLHWSGSTGEAYGVWTTGTNSCRFVLADTNGDGTADVAIKVKGAVVDGDIIGLNHKAVAVDDIGAATEEGVVAGSDGTGNVLTNDTDPDGDTLVVSAVRTGVEAGVGVAGVVGGAGFDGQYGHLTINADGSYTYAVDNSNTDVNALNGSESLVDNFTYTVDDGFGGTDTATLAITVHGANDAPAITSGDVFAVDENTTAVTTVTASDPDNGATQTFTIEGTGADDAKFQIDANTGTLSFITAPDYEVPDDVGGDHGYEVKVKVDDGLGGTDVQTITVNVNNVNDNAPVHVAPVSADVSVVENTAGVVFDADATDADGDTVTYGLGGTDAGLFSIDSATGEVSFITAPDFESPTDSDGDNVYSIDVIAKDGLLAHDTARAVTITVTDVNDVAPTFTSGATASEAENTIASHVVYDAEVTDPDGAATVFSLAAGGDSALFSIDPGTGEVRFLASPDFENPLDAGTNNVYDITVDAFDGVHHTTQGVAITVNDVNEAPEPEPIPTEDPNDFDSEHSAFTAPGSVTLGGTANNADVFDGSNSADNINGNNGNDTLYGHGGDDTLTGNNDNDLIYGQAGNDTIQGSLGNDFIYGGSGNDTIDGAAGNDTIYGGSGNDVITGTSNDDLIIGGYGNDNLNGGTGADTFQYLSALDTGDTIAGFLHGTDKINVHDIDANTGSAGNQDFIFDAAANANAVDGHVTWSESGGNTIVRFSNDGDAFSDWTITLTGTGLGLTGTDFVL